jgi:hypothetical protein
MNSNERYKSIDSDQFFTNSHGSRSIYFNETAKSGKLLRKIRTQTKSSVLTKNESKVE